MDVAVDPECGLVARGAGLREGHPHQDEVAAVLALAERIEDHEVGMLARERMHDFLQVVVTVEAVEGDVCHEAGHEEREPGVFEKSAILREAVAA
jgi:hypothetical protein